MNPPIPTHTPAVVDGFLEFLPEFLQCLVFSVAKMQSLSNVADVIQRSKLRDACGQHHGKETDEEVAMTTKLLEGFLTEILETRQRIILQSCFTF